MFTRKRFQPPALRDNLGDARTVLKAITDYFLSLEQRDGIGEGGSWDPTVTSATGTITTSVASGDYTRLGDIHFIRVGIGITTNGTGGTSVRFTLPFDASAIHTFYGRENVGGKQLQGIVSSGSNIVTVLNYDNTYPGADGAQLYINGFVS